MPRWSIKLSDPQSLTLAADARFTEIHYLNDHIWEFNYQQGEPPAMTLSTTFGLRVNTLRIFPRFVMHGFVLSNPASFFSAPELTGFYPNYLSFTYQPYQEIKITAEYRSIASHVISGRFLVTNQTEQAVRMDLELCAVLDGPPPSSGMVGMHQGSNQVLLGKADKMSVVCFLTGSPQLENSPYPALVLDVDLPPSGSRQYTWSLVAKPDEQEALRLSRLTTARSWDAETARIEMENINRTIDIQTGNPEWNAAFAFAQKCATSCIMAGTGLKHPSFVLSRSPDQGFSYRGDGKDYPSSWSGQTALDAWYLAGIILPAGIDLVQGFLDNFLETISDNGFIDFKPGLSGQRSSFLAQPVLVDLAARVHHHLQDPAWLAKVYDPLFHFFSCWISLAGNSGHIGFPVWQHPLQTGLEDIPLYDSLHPSSQGIEIGLLECPGLAAMLYRECQNLIRIARLINRNENIRWLEDCSRLLQLMVESTWDVHTGLYHYRDVWTHVRQNGQRLAEFSHNGNYTLDYKWDIPTRVVLHFMASNQYSRYNRVTIQGSTQQGACQETIGPNQLRWHQQFASYALRQVFTSIEQIEIHGLQADDRCWMDTVDHEQEDISLLLPLWAGIPNPEIADRIICQTIPNRCLKNYGISFSQCPDLTGYPESLSCVQPLWNALVIEGMLTYGYRSQAVDLFTRLMNGILPSLRQSHAFREYYHSSSAVGAGEFHSFRGLPPLEMFLQTLGVERLNEREIIIRDTNPYPWPVDIHYRSVTIHMLSDGCSIEFSSGQTISLDGPGLHRISLD